LALTSCKGFHVQWVFLLLCSAPLPPTC
jgi:hypothetical protein